jgi:hypothetical protein
MPRSLTAILTSTMLGAAIGLPVWILSFSGPAPSRAAAVVAARGCPTAARSARARTALAAAEARYRMESRGTVIHADRRQIEHDRSLLGALSAGNLGAALSAANNQLVRHVVQIRVLRGARVLLEANPTSLDVAGSSIELQAANGSSLGQLQITLQDVIGFIKLVHKLDGADVVVRGGGGQMRTSLPAAAKVSLPSWGCTQIGSHRYVVSSFNETSYTGEPLTIWLLTAA